MAKKASKKKAPPKGTKSRGNAKGKNQHHESPRSQTLPGMKQARNARLDNITEAISDERKTKNEALLEEKGLKKEAEREMVKKGISIYKNNGIELALVPGSPTLRVRAVKQTGEVAVSGGSQQGGDAEQPAQDGEEQAAGTDNEQPF